MCLYAKISLESDKLVKPSDCATLKTRKKYIFDKFQRMAFSVNRLNGEKSEEGDKGRER